jgi:hypothetical protein
MEAVLTGPDHMKRALHFYPDLVPLLTDKTATRGRGYHASMKTVSALNSSVPEAVPCVHALRPAQDGVGIFQSTQNQ